MLLALRQSLLVYNSRTIRLIDNQLGVREHRNIRSAIFHIIGRWYLQIETKSLTFLVEMLEELG